MSESLTLIAGAAAWPEAPRVSRRGARGNDAHARRTRGRRWHGLCARCAARALLAHPIRAPFLNGPNARVDSLLAPSTAQVYLTKLRARHLREHGDHLLSPHDPAEPAGAAGRSVFDLSVSGRPWALEVVGGWEKTKNKKQRGPGGPALRTRPRRGKKSDIDHGIS